jgi:transcriptional repressor NrdR
MRCPFCSFVDTQVKDSRPSDDNISIRRRRFCPNCDGRFTTFERIQLRELVVVKKNGDKKLFDRDKLLRSIMIALRKREIDQEKIEMLVNDVVRSLEAQSEGEVTTSLIGEMIMERLANIDQVAYVRFASVYRDFCEAKDFLKFVETLKAKPFAKQNRAEG